MGSSAGATAQSWMDKYNERNPDAGKLVQASTALLRSYGDTINGTAPSVAQQQLKQATDQNVAQQYGFAASMRGRSPGAGARQAAANTAAINQQAGSQAALLRAQETEQARAGLNQDLGRMDTGAANFAQIGEKAGEANDNMFGKILGGVGAAGAALFSDKKLKTDIEDGDQKVESFLDAMKAYSYKYKPSVEGKKGAPKGEHVSPMAQDLEKSEVGKDMVEDTPEGKVVDYGRGFGAMLAAQANLHERLKKLEGKKGGK